PDVRFSQYEGITPVRVPRAVQGCSTVFGPLPSGFLCLDTDAMPDGRMDRRLINYDAFGRITNAQELRGLNTSYKLSTTTYFPDGAPKTEGVVDGTSGDTVYSVRSRPGPTGRWEQTDSMTADGRTITGTVLRKNDANGRLQEYTDATGTITRYRYDLRGRLIETVEDGSRTVTFGYNDRDELVSVIDPDVGSAITATYDPDGQLASELLPNGLEVTQTYDAAGRPSQMRWTKITGCSSDCVWSRSDVVNRDSAGRITQTDTNDWRQHTEYDSVGRLLRSDNRDTVAGICSRAEYAYDNGNAGDSSRTAMTSTHSATGAACGTGTATSRTWTHDTADRITNSGWVFDANGRATSVPAPDSGGTGLLTASYYGDDRIRELTLDGRTHRYARDPLRRTRSIASTGASKPTITSTNHYADDSDSPISVTRSDGTTERDISGPSGMLVAIKDGTTLTYQLRDVQGSIIDTVPATGTPTRPDASSRYDAFGNILNSTPGIIDWTDGVPRYGWLGGHQRATQFQPRQGVGPPIEMGARVYLPATGRFLQRDPIEGGSLNDYDYAFQDPNNALDLDGLAGIRCQDGKIYVAPNHNTAPRGCQAFARRRAEKARRDFDYKKDQQRACRVYGGILTIAGLVTPFAKVPKLVSGILGGGGAANFFKCS
ncbi:MAG: RHS repeat-associated core domain-containing protein, partial [Tepidisphaeraceae bacterium]